MTNLEALEQQSGRPYRHTSADFDRVRELVRTAPTTLREIDYAVLEYWGTPTEVAEARAKARLPRTTKTDGIGADTITQRSAAASPSLTVRLADVIASTIRAAIKSPPVTGRLDALDQRVKVLEARPVLHDCGVWRAGTEYDAGALVSHAGSGWICSQAHRATGSEPDHAHFRLLVKRGRDGRDAR